MEAPSMKAFALYMCVFHCAYIALTLPAAGLAWDGSGCTSVWYHSSISAFSQLKPQPMVLPHKSVPNPVGWAMWHLQRHRDGWRASCPETPSLLSMSNCWVESTSWGHCFILPTKRTSAALKDDVHLAPLAWSHVLGIVAHLAAFQSYPTEMHPFEKEDPMSGKSLLSIESL